MLGRHQSHYSIARFDGALMYDDIRAGLMVTGITRSPIVQFKIKAGAQHHPAWAIDETAIEIYSYCQVAQISNVSPTHLQVSVAASWISGDRCSNLIVTNVEWHIASSRLREQAIRLYAEAIKHKKYPKDWPEEILTIPVVAI